MRSKYGVIFRFLRISWVLINMVPRNTAFWPGQAAHSEVSKERSAKEEAVARASKAERELDQARARAAVLDNKLLVSPSVCVSRSVQGSLGRYKVV